MEILSNGMINWKFCCSPLLFFYFDYYYYFLDLKYEKTNSFIPSQFSCTLTNHYLYFKIWLYVRCLLIEITVTSCMFPWLDSDVKRVEGEKQRVRMLSQTPRYEGISKSFEPNMERARNLDLFCFIFQRSPLPTPHTCPI